MNDLFEKLRQNEAYIKALSMIENEDEKKAVEKLALEFLSLAPIIYEAVVSGSTDVEAGI